MQRRWGVLGRGGVIVAQVFLLGFLAVLRAEAGTQTFTLATFNIENYLLVSRAHRRAKSAAARAKIRDCLCRIKPDVLALEEIGGGAALRDLRRSLGRAGLSYPYWDLVSGADTNLFVALLSRFPIAARRPHEHEAFLLDGRRFRASRGFIEEDIRVNPHYLFTLFVAHLKSKRPVPLADQSDLRYEEARILRRLVTARLARYRGANVAVVGDFNDSPDSLPLRTLIGRGRYRLFDTRPAEPGGRIRSRGKAFYRPRNITWTEFYGKEDIYSRIDYILLSPGMAREWDRTGTYVLRVAGWGLASDHRPIVARFYARDR